METLLNFSDRVDKLVMGVGKLAAWLAVPLMLVIVYDVIQRKLIGLGSIKLQELEWHFHAALFALTFGYAYLKDAHVRIELIRDNLKPRTRAVIEILGILLFLVPFCVLLLYFGFDFVARSWATDEASAATTGLTNRWIIKSVIPASFGLIALAGLSILIKCVVFLIGPERLRRRAGYYAGTHHADMGDAHRIDD